MGYIRSENTRNSNLIGNYCYFNKILAFFSPIRLQLTRQFSQSKPTGKFYLINILIFVRLYKNRKSNLKLYNTLFPSLKHDNIINLFTCFINSLKTGFKILKEWISFKVFLQFLISNPITFVKLFSVYLRY